MSILNIWIVRMTLFVFGFISGWLVGELIWKGGGNERNNIL